MKELIEIQNQLNAPKSRINKFGGYNYRNCEDIFDAVKPLLKSQNCVLIVTDEIVQIGQRIYVKAIATITNSEGQTQSVTAFAREEETKKGMDAAQITGACSSYARKYALGGLLLIDDAQDPDTQKPENKPESKTENKETLTDIETVELALSEMTTAKEVAEYWKANKEMQGNQEFVKLVTEKGKKLKANENK